LIWRRRDLVIDLGIGRSGDLSDDVVIEALRLNSRNAGANPQADSRRS
jgi:hypothetical protein